MRTCGTRALAHLAFVALCVGLCSAHAIHLLHNHTDDDLVRRDGAQGGARVLLADDKRRCLRVPSPFNYDPALAATPEFVVRCLYDGKLYLPSIDVIITSFGDGYITVDKPMWARACDKKTKVESLLNLTASFSLSPENHLLTAGTLAKGLVADSQQNMFPFRTKESVLGQPFYDEVTLAGWGDCGGSYLRGPTGTCEWDGSTSPPVGACEVQIDYNLPTGNITCDPVPYPFSFDMAEAATPEFFVICLRNGSWYLPSINVIITSFGSGYITVEKPMWIRGCNKKTKVESILNLTESFSLSPVNRLVMNGTLAKGLVADSQQNMFPFRTQESVLGQPFYDEVTLAGWGNCGGTYLRGPTGTCKWDGSTKPPVGACEIQIDYTLPTGNVTCPSVPYPFSFESASAATPEFLVVCLPNGKVHLPSINVIITSFGQEYITVEEAMWSKGCNKKTHVESILNLTTSFSLSPDNLLVTNGTLARGLVADSEQHMFPFRKTAAPLGEPFVGEVTLAGWGDCGGAYLKGPTGSCKWAGGDEPPVGVCQVEIKWALPNHLRRHNVRRSLSSQATVSRWLGAWRRA